MLVLDVETLKVNKIADLPFPFRTDNQSYAESKGVILSLVATKDRGLCLVRFTVSTNQLEIVAERLK